MGEQIIDFKLATVDEIAAALRLDPRTVYRMAQKGQIPAIKVGGSWRFEPDAVIAALRNKSNA